MYNGLNGEIMKEFPVKGKIVRVSRRKLRALVAEGIDVKVMLTLDFVRSASEQHTDE
jgi:hypothetical protein